MPNERDRLIGQRLAAVRTATGLTVRQVAERLGWQNHSRLTNYETGRRAITVSTLMILARALDTVPAVLLVDSPEAALLVQQIATDRERAQQLLYLSKLLDAPEPSAPEHERAP